MQHSVLPNYTFLSIVLYVFVECLFGKPKTWIFLSSLTINKVKEHSLTIEQEHLVKLLTFTRVQSSHFQDKYYLQNLYEATFLMDDQKSNTFVVWVDESEVYRHVNYIVMYVIDSIYCTAVVSFGLLSNTVCTCIRL